MKIQLALFVILIFPLSACATQNTAMPKPTATNPPVAAITQVPTKVPLDSPTALPVPTETPFPTATIEALPTRTQYVAVLFGAVKVEDAKAGFALEPIAAQIFEMELQKLVDAGVIEDFQVESLFVSVKGDHALYAEIM